MKMKSHTQDECDENEKNRIRRKKTYHKNGETLIVANAPPPAAADIGGSDPGCAETFSSVSIFVFTLLHKSLYG